MDDRNLILSFYNIAQLTEDFCGVEPVTHPPIERETRPPPLVDEEKLRKAYNEINSVLLACKLSLIFVNMSLVLYLLLLFNYSPAGDFIPAAMFDVLPHWSISAPTQRRLLDT